MYLVLVARRNDMTETKLELLQGVLEVCQEAEIRWTVTQREENVDRSQ